MAGDEDIDLARCSEMYRDANCEGARNYIRSLRKEGLLRKQLPGKDATLGTRIHASLEGYPEELGLKEEDIKDSCEALATLTLNEWLFRSPAELPKAETYYEERLTYTIAGTPFFTGKPDRVIRTGNDFLDINFKTGRRPSVDSALNLQLRSEIVLLSYHYQAETIAGAIVEPLVTRKPEIVVYGPKELKHAESEILEIVDRSEWSTRRTAGPWCYYCAARAFCEKAKALALSEPLKVDVAALPRGQDGAKRLGLIETAYQILDAQWEAYTTICLEELDPIPGWHISEDQDVRYIKNVDVAALRSDSSLVKKTIAVGKLEEFMAAKWKIKGKEFDQKFHALFGDVIGFTKKKGSLQRVPKGLLK